MLRLANKICPPFGSNRLVGNYAGDGPMFGVGGTTSPELAAPRMALALRGAAVLGVSAGTNRSIGPHPLPLWVLPSPGTSTGDEVASFGAVRNFFGSYCFSLGFGR